MVGVVVNVISVFLGGILGTALKSQITPDFSAKLNLIFGICAIGMGIPSIIQMVNMPAVIIAMVLGSAIGIILHIGEQIAKGGERLGGLMGKLIKQEHSLSMPHQEYISLLVTALVLFCSSGSSIFGCIDAGITGDSTILISKSILDLFTAMVFACSIGPVIATIAVPKLIIFLFLFFSARFIYPLTTPEMIGDLKACGGFILIATGYRIAKMRDFPVADMLPAMILVMPLSALWVTYINPLLSVLG